MPDRNQAIELKLLIEAIYLRYSYDFRDYSSASLKRRVLLALKQMRCESISELQRRILYTRRRSWSCCSSSPSQ